MNAITSASSLVMSAGSGVITGVAAGSAIVTVLSGLAISKGKDLYLKQFSLSCKHPTACKVAGLMLMSVGLLSGLASSAATGFFTSVAVGILSSSLGPVGTVLGITAGIIVGLASAAGIVAHFVKTVEAIKKDPKQYYMEPAEYVVASSIEGHDVVYNQSKEPFRLEKGIVYVMRNNRWTPTDEDEAGVLQKCENPRK